MRSARWREADYSGRAKPREAEMRRETAGEEAIGLEVPGVVAVVVIPGGGRRIPTEERFVRALRKRRCRAH